MVLIVSWLVLYILKLLTISLAGKRKLKAFQEASKIYKFIQDFPIERPKIIDYSKDSKQNTYSTLKQFLSNYEHE